MLLARDHSGQAALHWVADPSLVASDPFEEQVMPREMRFDLTLWPAWLGARAGPGARALKPSTIMFNAPRPTRACHLSIIKPLSTTRSLQCPWPLREPRGSSSPKASLERQGDAKHPSIGELWFPQASCKENGSLQWLQESRSPMNIQLTPQFLGSIEAGRGRVQETSAAATVSESSACPTMAYGKQCSD